MGDSGASAGRPSARSSSGGSGAPKRAVSTGTIPPADAREQRRWDLLLNSLKTVTNDQSWTRQQLEAFTGALRGSKVTVSSVSRTADGGLVFSLRVVGDDPGSGRYRADRNISIGRDGKVTSAYNAGFFANKPGGGLGVRMFTAQAKALSKGGLSELRVTAGGDAYSSIGRSGAMNGYYTWARFGYNATIYSRQLNDIRALFPDFRGTTLNELMTHKGKSISPFSTYNPKTKQYKIQKGTTADLWRVIGHGFAGTFDLRPGSKSFQILNAYNRELKRRKKLTA